MSIGQVHPSCTSPTEGKEYKIGLDSLKLFNTIRQSRHTSKENTIIITSPKNSISNRAFLTPKRSQFTSQDQIVEEEDFNGYTSRQIKRKFDIVAKRLMILLSFFRQMKYPEHKEKTSQLKQIHRKRRKLPFYPNQLQLWKQFMSLQTLFTLLLYPIYISLSNNDNLDDITIIILILDLFYLFDIILKLLSCQIDNDYSLIDTFKEIFIFNIKRWLIPDFLSIFPFKLFIEDPFNLFWLNIFKLIRFIKYFCYIEKQIYYETQNTNQSKQYFEKLFQLDGKIISILKIFKNMLILITLFGCLFHSVILYEDLEIFTTNKFSIYVQGLYWAIQTVTVIGYGDIAIYTSMQYNLTIVWIFIGVGFYSFTIGNLASILEQSSSNDTFQEDLDAIDTLLQQILIPDELSNQLLQYFYYNIENNPFWNYKKIIETLPTQSKVYAIAFCAKKLIENVNIFSFDINFAAAILPYFSIYCFKQYDIIYYNGSPSLEVFFLVAGEIRLCDNEGNTLLNIQEGYIFGEIEILQDCNRKQSAIASKDSIVIMCPVNYFLQLVQEDDNLLFEIEQLGLRRKILLYENLARIKKSAKQIKRISVIDNNLNVAQQQYTTKKQMLERQFKKNISKDNYQQLQKKLMRFIFGQKQEKKWKYQAIFKMAVRKVIDIYKQRIKLHRKTSLILGKQMLQNFVQVQNDEKKIQNQIQNNRQIGKHQKRVKVNDILKQYANRSTAQFLITPYYFYDEIMNEVKEEKILQKQKQNQIYELSNRLIKLNLVGQLKIFETMYEDLIQKVDHLQNEIYETFQNVEEMEAIYYQISLQIASIL